VVWWRQGYWLGWFMLIFWCGVGIWVVSTPSGGRPTPLAGRIAEAAIFLALSFGLAGYCFAVLTRPRLVADGDGLTARNVISTCSLPWPSVVRFVATDRKLNVVTHNHRSIRLDAASIPGLYTSRRPQRVAEVLESMRLQYQHVTTEGQL